jgi:membrane-associated phospholipid phosphatase
MNKYLSLLGYLGPNTLLALILITFASQRISTPYPYLAVLAWQILSHLLNVTLKNSIRAPRPLDSDKDIQLKPTPTFANYLTIHRQYGMPSGHAQACVSELTFIALYFKKPLLTCFALTQTALTLWQRYATHRHSVKQLIAGSVVGLVVGLVFYRVFALPDKHMISIL